MSKKLPNEKYNEMKTWIESTLFKCLFDSKKMRDGYSI
jgi:hypothetical protein